MKVIQKKISLEQFKSRMHGIIPAYFKNGTDNVYSFNGKTKFDNGKRIPYTNYGLVPMGIKWEKGKYANSCLSYNTIVSWFHFLEFYVNLLSKHGCLNENYNNAVEYFNYERSDYSLEECAEFDKKAKVICGEPTQTLFDLAESVYNEMVNKYFPKFEIPNGLQGEWNKKYLTINEVHYWIEWSKQFEGMTSENDCKNNENCCDCEKFFKLGGIEMIGKLNEFLSSIQEVNSTCKCDECLYDNCFIKIPIQLTVNIDDLGEYSIFCEDWEGGVKYYAGDVVRYDDKDWSFSYQNKDTNNEYIEDAPYGSMYSNTYHEYYFGLASGLTLEDKALYEDGESNNVKWRDSQFMRRTDYLQLIGNNSSSADDSENSTDNDADVSEATEGQGVDNIVGCTESKLSSFILSTELVYDNLGNKLPGILSGGTISEGYVLGIPYKPKTSVHLTRIGENAYWGDYLHSIVIDNASKKCIFTYFMGCTIPNNDAEPTDGVKYVDETILVQKQCKYYLDDFTFYTLNYYEIEHEKINYKDSGNNYNSSVDKALFEVRASNQTNDWFTNFPLLREEYMIGSSSMQNIENDIYINRGTARSFDYHLKLMEVNSLESLEQYGNGFFKIINN